MTPGVSLPQAIFDRVYFGTPMENRIPMAPSILSWNLIVYAYLFIIILLLYI